MNYFFFVDPFDYMDLDIRLNLRQKTKKIDFCTKAFLAFALDTIYDRCLHYLHIYTDVSLIELVLLIYVSFFAFISQLEFFQSILMENWNWYLLRFSKFPFDRVFCGGLWPSLILHPSSSSCHLFKRGTVLVFISVAQFSREFNSKHLSNGYSPTVMSRGMKI